MDAQVQACEAKPIEWWESHRLRYNLTLIAAAPVSLACLIMVWWLFEARLPCLEVVIGNLVAAALGPAIAGNCDAGGGGRGSQVLHE